MKLLYGKGFDEHDLQNFREIIRSNIISGIYGICQAVEVLGFKEDISNIEAFDVIMNTDGNGNLTRNIATHVTNIWNEEPVQVF